MSWKQNMPRTPKDKQGRDRQYIPTGSSERLQTPGRGPPFQIGAWPFRPRRSSHLSQTSSPSSVSSGSLRPIQQDLEQPRYESVSNPGTDSPQMSKEEYTIRQRWTRNEKKYKSPCLKCTEEGQRGSITLHRMVDCPSVDIDHRKFIGKVRLELSDAAERLKLEGTEAAREEMEEKKRIEREQDLAISKAGMRKSALKAVRFADESDEARLATELATQFPTASDGSASVIGERVGGSNEREKGQHDAVADMLAGHNELCGAMHAMTVDMDSMPPTGPRVGKSRARVVIPRMPAPSPATGRPPP